METGNGHIESTHVIGHEVDYLANAGLRQGFLAQFEAFSIDERTSRDPHLHAYEVHFESVEVVSEDGQNRSQNNSSCVKICGACRHIAVWIEVTKQLSQAKWLADSKIMQKLVTLNL